MSGENDGNAAPPPAFEPPGADTPPPPPGYTPFNPGDPGAAAQWGGPPEPPKKRKLTRVLVSVGVVVALMGFGGVREYMRRNGDPFTTPQTIGDATLLTDPQFAQIAKDTREQVDNVHRAVSGVYAINGVPSFLIVAGDANDSNAKSIYDTFRDEAEKDGTKLGPATPQGKVLCATVEDAEAPGVACFWGSKKSDGVLMHFGTDDPAVAGRLAQLAWDGVES